MGPRRLAVKICGGLLVVLLFFFVHTDGDVFDKGPSVVTFATGCKYVLLLEFAACRLVVRPPACVSGWLSFAVFALLPN